jgi:hypothetical protein
MSAQSSRAPLQLPNEKPHLRVKSHARFNKAGEQNTENAD